MTPEQLCGSSSKSGAVVKPPVSTGNPLGDAVNAGAQMWITQNIKNPYGANFASSFATAFIKGIVAGDSPEAQKARADQAAALQRQQLEEAQRRLEAEQQRINAMFARLDGELKLTGGTSELALKTGGPLSELHMKLGDIQSGQGYGIQGLPGIYTNGAVSGDDGSGGLHMKLGDDSGATSASGSGGGAGSGGGIPGLPGLNLPGTIDLNNVQPQQAPQVADASLAVADPQERGAVEDIALKAAEKDPTLNAPSDDPVVQNFQNAKKELDSAEQANQKALQDASTAQGRAQADQTALTYAKQQMDPGSASEQMKQAYAQMEAAAGSDEEVAVKAREMFDSTGVTVSIKRDQAAGALSEMSSLPVIGGPAENHSVGVSAVPIPRQLPGLSLKAKPQLLAPPPPSGGHPLATSLEVCVAEAANKAPYRGSPVPTLEQLHRQLEGAEEAYRRMVETQEQENEDKHKWLEDMAEANVDMAGGFIGKAVEDITGPEESALSEWQKEMEKETAATRKEVNELEAQLRSGTLSQAEQEAAHNEIMRVLLQREELRDAAGAARGARMFYEGYDNGEKVKDFYEWGAGGATSKKEFEEENAVTKSKGIDLTQVLLDDDGHWLTGQQMAKNAWKLETSGDLEGVADGFGQLIKIGIGQDGVRALLGVVKIGGAEVGVTEIYEGLSLAVDTSFDLLTDAFAFQRIKQINDNTAKMQQARLMLAERIRQTRAEIGCYPKAAQGTKQEAAR